MGQGDRADRRIGFSSTSDKRADGLVFAAFYQRERPRLMRFFLRNLGSEADADDLSQETLARFATAAPAQLVTPQAYLTRIATNLLKDHAERGSTRISARSTLLDEVLDAASGVDAHRQVQSRQELAKWTRILEELNPRTLEILLLNRVEGYSYRQIASDLGEPLWVVQKHMLKAIKHIAAHRETDHD